jgi:hypothetical protein
LEERDFFWRLNFACQNQSREHLGRLIPQAARSIGGAFDFVASRELID